nr:hypothetical protein [Gammaproteobacteria bacterium AqS3]
DVNEDSDFTDEEATLTFSITGAGYSNSPTATFTVNIKDNDTPPTGTMTASTAAIDVSEGRSFSDGLVRGPSLSFSPTPQAGAVLKVSSNNPDLQACLSFLIANCPETTLTLDGSTIRLTNLFYLDVNEDSDFTDEEATLTFSITGAGYSNSPTATFKSPRRGR